MVGDIIFGINRDRPNDQKRWSWYKPTHRMVTGASLSEMFCTARNTTVGRTPVQQQHGCPTIDPCKLYFSGSLKYKLSNDALVSIFRARSIALPHKAGNHMQRGRVPVVLAERSS